MEEVVREQAAIAAQGTARMHERNGDSVNPVSTQEVSAALS